MTDRKPVPFEIAAKIKNSAINHYDVEGDNQDTFDVRHWGSYEVLDTGSLTVEEGGWAYCDKVIALRPGAKLSVQKHNFRREDWAVLKGEIVVSHGDTPDDIKETVVSAYGNVRKIHLPENGIHFVENRSNEVAHFYERQYGPLLDERDNLRYPTKSSYTSDGCYLKGDSRQSDFEGVAESITSFEAKGFDKILDGYWSMAYKNLDLKEAALHEPRVPKGNTPTLYVSNQLLLKAE